MAGLGTRASAALGWLYALLARADRAGCGLYVRAVNTEKTFFVDPALVIFASNVLIRSSIASTDNKKNVSNIVIQRVLGAVNVRHDKIVEAERLSVEHFTRLECA